MLRLAQIALAVAILATLNSLLSTWEHVSDPAYTVHAQLHFGREIVISIAALLIAAYFMYGPARYRTMAGWTAMAIAILGVAGAFWLSLLFTGSPIPGLQAALNHIGNTVFGLLALGLSWKPFRQPR